MTRDTADIIRLLDIEVLWDLDADLVRDLSCPNPMPGVNRNLHVVADIVVHELLMRSL